MAISRTHRPPFRTRTHRFRVCFRLSFASLQHAMYHFSSLSLQQYAQRFRQVRAVAGAEAYSIQQTTRATHTTDQIRQYVRPVLSRSGPNSSDAYKLPSLSLSFVYWVMRQLQEPLLDQSRDENRQPEALWLVSYEMFKECETLGDGAYTVTAFN